VSTLQIQEFLTYLEGVTGYIIDENIEEMVLNPVSMTSGKLNVGTPLFPGLFDIFSET
jgi:hypothetical protein